MMKHSNSELLVQAVDFAVRCQYSVPNRDDGARTPAGQPEGPRDSRSVLQARPREDFRGSAGDRPWEFRGRVLCQVLAHTGDCGYQENVLSGQAKPGEVAGHPEGDQVSHKKKMNLKITEVYILGPLLTTTQVCISVIL